eukprot:gene4773-5835_t
MHVLSETEVARDRPGEVMWPNPEWQEKGGESFWGHFRPSYGAQGVVQYVWEPNASNPVKQSNSYETICLVLLSDEHIVPVNSRGLELLRDDHDEGPSSASFWDKRQVRLLDVTQ